MFTTPTWSKFRVQLVKQFCFSDDAVFSPCSKEDMNKRLEIVSKRGTCFAEVKTTLEISLCGNGIVDPGEECDCGPDIYHCDDQCCYPANIPLAEKVYYNKSAISCYMNNSHYCLSNSPLIYGVYVPLSVIIIVTIIIVFVLKQDWTKDKQLFRHVTEGNIRIVKMQT